MLVYLCSSYSKISDSQLATTSGLFEEEAHLTVFADSTEDSLTESSLARTSEIIWHSPYVHCIASPSIKLFTNASGTVDLIHELLQV